MIKSFLKTLPRNLFIIWALGLLLRLVASSILLYNPDLSPDYHNYRLPIAECITSGQWLYCDCAYNHTPLYPYISSLMNWASQGNKHLQPFFINLPLALGDALVPIAIFILMVALGKSNIAKKCSIFYSLNPICILEVGIAHWDGFTTLFFLVSLIFIHQGKWHISGIWAGLGALLKQFPVTIILIAFAKSKDFPKSFLLGIVVLAVVFMGFLPFVLHCPETFFQNLTSHPLWQGDASTKVGIGTVKDLFEHMYIPYSKGVWFVLFVVLIAVPFFMAKQDNSIYFAGILMVTLAWFTYVTHRQLIVWAMPFLIMITLERRQYWAIIVVFIGYFIRILKPDWYFGLIHLGVGIWYYYLFFISLNQKKHMASIN